MADTPCSTALRAPAASQLGGSDAAPASSSFNADRLAATMQQLHGGLSSAATEARMRLLPVLALVTPAVRVVNTSAGPDAESLFTVLDMLYVDLEELLDKIEGLCIQAKSASASASSAFVR